MDGDAREPFRRTVFTDGMLLCAGDLQAQQAYDSGKRHLLSRTFFGWGVVYGLSLKLEKDCVVLSPGLALDREGREIYVPHTAAIGLDGLFREGKRRPGDWRVFLEYGEKYPQERTELTLPDPSMPGSAPACVVESFDLRVEETDVEKGVLLGRLCIRHKQGGWECDLKPLAEGFHHALYPGSDTGGRVSTGSLMFDLRQRPSRHGVYYSREISHGLGPGEVFVTLAVKGWQEGDACLLTGDIGLFGAQIRCAAKAFPDRGTFIAAVSCGEAISRHVRLEWRAEWRAEWASIPSGGREEPSKSPGGALVREERPELGGQAYTRREPPPDTSCMENSLALGAKSASRIAESALTEKPAPTAGEASGPPPSKAPAAEKGLHLDPPVTRVLTGESLRLRALYDGAELDPAQCRFAVREKEGGTIGADGLYTAPGRAGLFRVEASLSEPPGESAVSYVFVHSGEE